MREGHAYLLADGLNQSHFNAVAEDLTKALQEMGVAQNLIDQVITIATSTKNDVLGL